MGGNKVRRWAMVVDLRRCTGCQACTLACKAEHGVPVGSWFAWTRCFEVGRYPHTRRRNVPTLCNHCEAAPCVAGCPVGASYRQADGIVRVDHHACIACKYCFWACPYGVRILDPDLGVCRKCELCVHRLDAGLAPACVEACPAGALVCGDRLDPADPVAQLLGAQTPQVLKPELGTQPQVLYLGGLPAALMPGAASGVKDEP